MHDSHPGQAPQASSPIAIIVDSMNGAGPERVALRLAQGLIDKGHKVDLLLIWPQGEYRDKVFSHLSIYYFSSRIRSYSLLDHFRCHKIKAKKILINPLREISARWKLKKRYPSCHVPSSWVRRALKICRYLDSRNPKAMISLLHQSNMAAIYAHHLAKSPPPLMVSLRNNVELFVPENQPEISEAYLSADSIVCVSKGVAEAAIRICNLPRAKISVIYNPIPYLQIYRMGRDEVSHPWFLDNKIPVIFTAGRISPQQDPHTLVSAFSLVCKRRKARLVIMTKATADQTRPLLAQVAKLGLKNKVDILEFDPNPFRYMQRASCFVLSTNYEGFSNVLPEALACGLPVISTDVRYGPREILEGGKWGKLVAVRSPEKLASAILETLDGDRAKKVELVERARFFCTERAVHEYLALTHRLSREKRS